MSASATGERPAPSFTAAELARRIDAEIVGDPDVAITGIAPLDTAGVGQLSHLSSPAWRASLPGTGASAVIVARGDAAAAPCTALIVRQPYLAYARLSALFATAPPIAAGRAVDACIDAAAELAGDVAVGPGAVIGPGARIGAGTRIGANAVIGADAVLGADCRIHPGAVICHAVRMGDRCVIHPNAVIGADGFGFTPDEQGRLVAIAQLGSVRLDDDVEVGAASTIDRGALGDTIIERGVKIDNQVQIGHNCRIGHDTVICGCTGIVGSSRIGAHCVLAGGVGVGGDGPVQIADHTVVSGMTHVSRTIETAGVYSSGTLALPTRSWKRNALRFTQLDAMARRIAALERQLAAHLGAADPAGPHDDRGPQ